MAVQKITDGVVVSLAYVLTVDGEEVERVERDDPLDYLHGAENIVPGLEAALSDKKVGDHLDVTLTPEEGYGDYYEDEIETIAREDIPDADALEVGMVVEIEDEDGYWYEATVTDITPKAIVLDFNPPLAGKSLHYEVQVVALRPADDLELEHGHPHSMDEDEDEFYEDEQ